MIQVQLPFPVPLSACFTNAPGKGRVPTPRYKAWQTEALWTIKAQRAKPIDGMVSVFIRLVAPDKRHRDAGNCDKSVGDILVKAGIIKDDSNRYIRRLTYEWAEDGPPCTVLIMRVEQGMAA